MVELRLSSLLLRSRVKHFTKQGLAFVHFLYMQLVPKGLELHSLSEFSENSLFRSLLEDCHAQNSDRTISSATSARTFL